MSSNCIITQVHIPDYDVQGSINKTEKLRLVEYGLRHLRAFNPQSFIIVTGHGHRPTNLDLCDHVYWEDTCRPLNQHGYVEGMPAQFFFVSQGMSQALKMGFTRVLKTRGDCVIGIPEITAHCDKILDAEGKKLLITQQTGPERMGDCFMFGDLKILHEVWWKGNQVWDADGLQNTAINFRKVMADSGDWTRLVRSTCSFRDVNKLKFACLRWNFHKMGGLPDDLQREMMNPNFDFEPYHWGRANGWHVFDGDGNMSGSADWLWSQKGFYETSDT